MKTNSLIRILTVIYLVHLLVGTSAATSSLIYYKSRIHFYRFSTINTTIQTLNI